MKKIKVSFLLIGSKKTKNKECPIYCRILLSGKRINLSTGVYIKKTDWNKTKSKVKDTHLNYEELNKILDDMEKKVHAAVDYCSSKNIPVSLEMIKHRLKNDEYDIKSLFQLYDHFIKSIEARAGVTHSLGTIKHFYTNKNKLSNFVKATFFTNDISLNNIDYEFIIKLEAFLGCSIGNHVNTVAKTIKRLRTVWNHGLKMGWAKHDPFESYKFKEQLPARQYLTLDEVRRIENLDLKNNSNLNFYKDIFLFMCYTGLAYGDMITLRTGDVFSNTDGKKFIRKQRGKTKQECLTLLNPRAEAILLKYSNLCINGNYIFPSRSNQRINDNLKKIAELAGIDKSLTCHIGRHTFATLSLELGVPIETVAKSIGHGSLKSTQIYGKITPTKVANDYKNVAYVFS